MKNRITGNRYVIGLAAVALAAAVLWGAGWLQPAKAQQVGLADGSVRFIAYQIIGIIPGQKLRTSVGTIAGSRGDIVWTYRISNSSNQVLFESERMPVPSGEWRHSTVSREDLNIEGEPGTRRAQVMVQVIIQAPRGTKSSDIIGSLEVLDEEGGTAFRGEDLISLPVAEIIDFPQ